MMTKKKLLTKKEVYKRFIVNEHTDLEKMIGRLYEIYRLYPGEKRWNDLKLLEAIRSRYDKILQELESTELTDKSKLLLINGNISKIMDNVNNCKFIDCRCGDDMLEMAEIQEYSK